MIKYKQKEVISLAAAAANLGFVLVPCLPNLYVYVGDDKGDDRGRIVRHEEYVTECGLFCM